MVTGRFDVALTALPALATDPDSKQGLSEPPITSQMKLITPDKDRIVFLTSDPDESTVASIVVATRLLTVPPADTAAQVSNKYANRHHRTARSNHASQRTGNPPI